MGLTASDTAAGGGQRSLARILLFNVLTVIIAVVLLEAVSFFAVGFIETRQSAAIIHDQRAAIYPEEMSDRTFSKSRLYLTHVPFASRDYNIDDHGFRSIEGVRDIFANYDPKKVNVFAFGASGTFGKYVKDRETWPQVLQHRLRQTIPNADVYNLGIGGFSNFDEVHLLVDMLAQGRVPSVAVFLDGGRFETCPEREDRSSALRQFETGRITRLIQMSNVVRLAHHVSDKWAVMFKSPPTTNAAEPVDFALCGAQYAARAALATRLLDGYGAKAFFVLQPNGFTIPNYATYRFWAYTNQTAESFTFYHQLYDAYASRSSAVATIVDMRSILDEAAATRDDVLADASHPAAAGQAIIAAHVQDLIMPSLTNQRGASRQ
jgi:lysophospholipase L1-like esterase